MEKQDFVLRFERFIKSDNYWKKVYEKIAKKIKSDNEYRKFVRREHRKPVEEALETFEFRLFSESSDIEKLSKMSEHQLFNAFMKFYIESKIRRSLVPVYRIPPPEYVKGLLAELGDKRCVNTL